MATLNFIANVFQGGTAETGASGNQSFTTGRHILAILYAQRNAHENGLGAGWSLTDDASTNSPTWTQRGLSSIFTIDADEIQIAIYTSDELTATETFALTADASSGADTFRYRFSIYEIIDGDGTIDELVYDDHTGSGDDWVLNLAAAPVSGDAQVIAGSTFGGGAANYDATLPATFSSDNSGTQLVAMSTTTGTTQNESYGKAGTQDAVAVRLKIEAAGDITVNVGLAAETDTALAITIALGGITKAIGLASETDTALAAAIVLANLNVPAGLASEADTALPVTVVLGGLSVPVGIASETDTSLPVTVISGGTIIVNVGLATETNTALAVSIITDNFPHGDTWAGSATNTPGTSHTVSQPGSIVSGDILIAHLMFNSDTTVTEGDGDWTQLSSNAGSPGQYEIWGRVADGTEGATDVFTTSTSQAGAFEVVKITRSLGGLVAGVDYDLAVSSVSQTATPDPPNVAASWGSDDNLFITGTGYRGDNAAVTAYPTSYDDNQNHQVSTNGGGGGAGVGVATRELAGSSDNPGTFTLDESERQFSSTMVFAPPMLGIVVAAGLVIETDTALSVAVALANLNVAVGVAIEADSALPVTIFPPGPITAIVGLAAESDTALPVTAILEAEAPVEVGIAIEIDTALPVYNPTVTVGIAEERNTALPVSINVAVPDEEILSIDDWINSPPEWGQKGSETNDWMNDLANIVRQIKTAIEQDGSVLWSHIYELDIEGGTNSSLDPMAQLVGNGDDIPRFGFDTTMVIEADGSQGINNLDADAVWRITDQYDGSGGNISGTVINHETDTFQSLGSANEWTSLRLSGRKHLNPGDQGMWAAGYAVSTGTYDARMSFKVTLLRGHVGRSVQIVDSGFGGGTLAPTIPAFSSSPTIITAGTDVAVAIAAGSEGEHFLLAIGAHDIDNVLLKKDMHIRFAAGASADGVGNNYFVRPTDEDASGVVIGGDPAFPRPLIKNYGNGTTNQGYGAITGRTHDILGSPGGETYRHANDWFIYHLDLKENGASAFKLGDNWTVYDNEIHGHEVTGINGDRVVGGLIYGNILYWNALNPATGASSNGANIKVTWINADVGRTSITPVDEAKEQMVISNNTVEALDRLGGTGDTNIGIWLDLDCQDVLVEHNLVEDHPNTGIFVEGCNNCEIAHNTVRGTLGFGPTFNSNFRNAAIANGESTNINTHHNTLENCDFALMNRMSNRTSDWLDPVGGANYGWSAGPRYWLLDTVAIPAPSGQSNIWTGDNTFDSNVLNNCNKVVINEGTDTAGQTTHGSTVLSGIVFTNNDYSGSPGIEFYEVSLTALTLFQWQALGRQ